MLAASTCGTSHHDMGLVRTGAHPNDVLVVGSTAWVANLGSGTVSRVDLGKARTVATIRAGTSPDGVVLGTDGSVWVTSTGDNAIYQVSAATNEVVGKVDVNRVTQTRHPRSNDAWLGGLPTDHVTVFDPSSGTIDAVISLPGAAWTARAFGAAWVGSSTANTITRFDEKTGVTLGVSHLPWTPWRIAPSRGELWVSSFAGNGVMRLNPEGRLEATIKTPGHAKGVTVARDGEVWVSGYRASLLPNKLEAVDPRPSAGFLARIDATANRLGRVYKTGATKNGTIAFADGALWFADYGRGGLRRFVSPTDAP